MQQVEILYKQLRDEQAKPLPDQQKIKKIIAELQSRGQNVAMPCPDEESDHHEPFEDEGAADDDFID